MKNLNLGKGIPHLFDLKPQKFMEAISNLDKFEITEKIDGVNLIFGLDDKGIYVSRESKGGIKVYNPSEFESTGANNIPRAVLHALLDVSTLIRRVLEPGDIIECEILFGRQPNAIVYGSNRIVLLRMIAGSDSKIPTLVRHCKDTMMLSFSEMTYIDENKGIDRIQANHQWSDWTVTTVPIIDINLLTDSVKQKIKMYQTWYECQDTLTDEANVLAEWTFKTALKLEILESFIRDRQPTLRDCVVEEHEDFGIEGIVLRDPETEEQYKIVDKERFTLINQFFHHARNKIKRTSWADIKKYKHLYKEISLPPNIKPIYDNMLGLIAKDIGNPELDNYMTLTRRIKKYRTKEAFFDSWLCITFTDNNLTCVQQWRYMDIIPLKTSIVKNILDSMSSLKREYCFFQQNWNDYCLTLQSGKDLRYTKTIRDRTLLMAAEVWIELEKMYTEILKATTIEQVGEIIYRKQLKHLH